MKHLKLFFALFAMLALGVGNAWGEEVTVTKTTNTLVSELSWTVSSGSCAGCYTEFDLDNAITISTTGTPNCGSVWGTTTNDWRLYQNQNGNVIVSAKTGYELVSIKFTYSQSNSGTLKDGSTTVTTKTVVNCSGLTTKTLTVGNTGTKTNGQVKITEFSVTYTQTSADSGTEEPVLSSIEISGDLENKTYEEGDELDLTGLTVLANYESGDPKDVTNDVEWSYEPLTAGQTSVTVTATYEDKMATQPIYGLTVNEHIVTPGEKCTGTLGYAFWGLTAEKLTATANEINYTKEFDDVTVNIKNGSKANAYFKADHTRVYSGGYTMTFSVPDGYIITDIAFTASGDNWEGTHTANVGTMSDNKNWTGANQNVTITFNGSCRIESICVTYKADVKYALTITEPTEGGTLVVKDGENTLTSGAEIYEGTKLTVTATPATGYENGVVVVKNASDEDVTDAVYEAGTLTMPAYAVTISATFEKKPCTLLNTPVVTATPTYNSATLTWAAVANAAKYSVKVGTADAVETTETSYEVTGLTAETEYTYQVQAIAEAEQDTYCDSEVAEGTFTTATAPTATLTLSDIEGTTTKTGALNGTITLPTEAAECSKTFVGWDSKSDCAVAPEYAPGAEYTFTTLDPTLYAVYADGEGGGTVTITPSAVDNDAENDIHTFTIDAAGYSLTAKKNSGSSAPTINASAKDVRIYAKGTVTLTAPKALNTIVFNISTQGKKRLAPITASVGAIATQASGDATVTWTGDATEVTFTVGDNANYGSEGATKAGQLCFGTIIVTTAGSYSNYSTTCAAAPIATVNPTSVTATAAGVEGKVTVTYENVNTENVAVALFNDEACTETFTAGWLTASLDGDKHITYTVAATTLYTERKAYIKLTAPETNDATDPDVVVIPVTQAAKDKVFASLEALLAAITPTTEGVEVTVTLTNEVIQDFYTSGSYRNGIALNVPYQGGVKVIEIYCKDVPAEWVKGGKVSGTITCPWKLYNSTWELCPTAWTELTYTAPATVKSIAVSGTPTKTTYVDGEAFDPTGLVVTATLTDDSTEPIDVALVDWTFDPETLSKGETSVSVVATYNTMASAAYEVTGLTVNDIPTKTVAEFIAAGGTRCYLEGIVSGLTEGNSMKYGNFDLTDASGTIYVYGCLNEAGEKQKFAELGVKNGDMIKVIADEYELYDGTKDEAIDVQYVSHISAATITIADITMEVGETKNIAATITPAAAETAVVYKIKENTDNAISLSGNTISADAVGTATITATIATAAEYMGKTVEFTVTVNAKSTKEKVVILAQYDGKWYALKADKVDEKTIAALEVTYFEGKLYNVDDADKALIEWDRAVVDGNATFKNGENYLSAVNSVNLTLSANACDWVYEGGIYKIESSDRTFLYRAAANGFRNYDKDNAGTDDYSSLPVVTAPVYATGYVTYTRNVTNKYGTICLPYASKSTTGAIFYRVAGKETGKVYLESVDALEAGVPYIFEKTANTITVTCQGEAVAKAASANGLIGNFTNEYVVPVDNYILYNNAFIPADGTTNKVNAYRAYLDMDAVTGGAPVQMPGRRYIGMDVQGENVETGVEDLFTTDAPVKVIENGQLIIIRDGVKYNVQGQKL